MEHNLSLTGGGLLGGLASYKVEQSVFLRLNADQVCEVKAFDSQMDDALGQRYMADGEEKSLRQPD